MQPIARGLYKNLFAILFFTLAVSAFIFMNSGRVDAAPRAIVSNLDNVLPNSTMTSNWRYDKNGKFIGPTYAGWPLPSGNNGYLVVGTGAFDESFFAVTYETTNKNGFSLNIIDAKTCLGSVDKPVADSKATTTFVASSPDFNVSTITTRSSIITTNCSSPVNQSINIGSNQMASLGKNRAGEELFGGVFLAWLKGSGSNQNSFKLNAPVGVKLGFSTEVVKRLSASMDPIPVSDPTMSAIMGPNWAKAKKSVNDEYKYGINLANTNLNFYDYTNYGLDVIVSGCEAKITAPRIRFYDVDHGHLQGKVYNPDGTLRYNFLTMRLVMSRQSLTNPNDFTWNIINRQLLTGDHVYKEETLPDLQPGYKYRIEIQDVSQPNALQFSISSSTMELLNEESPACDPPPPPELTAFTCSDFTMVGGMRSIGINERFTMRATVDVTNPANRPILDAMLADSDPSRSINRQLQAGIINRPTAPGDSPGWNTSWSSPYYPTFVGENGGTYRYPPDKSELWGGADQNIAAVDGVVENDFYWFDSVNNKYIDRHYYQRLGLTKRTFSFSVQSPANEGDYNIGLRFLDRFEKLKLGPWLDVDNNCMKTISVRDPKPVATIDVGSNCSIIYGSATDDDSPDGILELHLRFDTPYSANPRPQDATIFTDASGNWSWTVPDSFKQNRVRSIWVDVLGEDRNGNGNIWLPATNSGLVSIGPCVPQLECEINTIPVSINKEFNISVALKNNTASDIPVNGTATFEIYNSAGTRIFTGSGAPYNTATNSYYTPAYPQTVSPGGSLTIRSLSPPILTVPAAGLYDVRWTVSTTSGPPAIMAVGDCASANGGDDAIDATTRPYVKFYGNDVIAGGDYGATCSVSGDPDVLANGAFTGSQPHATYKGSAAELAVFATGQINGVLPGSQNTTRPLGSTLGFANSSAGSGSLAFGGGFTDPMCVDDFWASRPENLQQLPVTDDPIASNLVAKKVDLASLPDGNYEFNGQVHMYTTSPLKSRLSIYVNGTTVIGSTTAPDYNYEVAYDTNGWTDKDKIPMLRIVTLGNVFIDDNVSRLDGLIIAEPNPSIATDLEPNGEIHTCSQFSQGVNLTYPTLNQNSIALGCNHQLVVNGAFIAKRVKLLRTLGDVSGAPVPPEAYSSATIAEVFRFSPELYLALLSEGTQNLSGSFDSIVSLPPSL